VFGHLGKVVCILVGPGKVEIAGVGIGDIVEGGVGVDTLGKEVGPDILAVERALVGVETLPV
jgi:hypothetical protein